MERSYARQRLLKEAAALGRVVVEERLPDGTVRLRVKQARFQSQAVQQTAVQRGW